MSENIITMNNNVIGVMDQSGKVHYDRQKITEIVAGQASNSRGGSFRIQSFRKSYRYDTSRKSNEDAIYTLWKNNPLMQSRIVQLNSLVFGRGFGYMYDDENINKAIDRFWRFNRIKQKLNPMLTDAQLFGEVFIALIPQDTGDVTMCVYESTQVEIDFDPQCVDIVNQYIVGYQDEEDNTDKQLSYLPLYQYLNELEYTGGTGTIGKTVRKIRKALSGNKVNLQGHDGVMVHVKFNSCSSEVHGTSDFRQVYGTINDYMDFRGDRALIHQNYGSPMFDIEIDTDDPDVITDRIDELAGFTIGSNPVHNAKEKWTPLEFKGNADNAEYDEKAFRGLICAGMQFPEHLLFNQSQGDESDDGTFALNKLAEDRQDAFGDAFSDIHKFVASVAGLDTTKLDEGQIIFPEISTMSEKAKAETYVLKVGANICSRKTACINTGHQWNIEEKQIQEEMTMFTPIAQTEEGGGIMGGRFSTKVNNQDPGRDDGSDDRKRRADAQNVTTQTFGDRKENN